MITSGEDKCFGDITYGLQLRLETMLFNTRVIDQLYDLFLGE